MQDAVLESWVDYELLDSGDGKKLERFGRYVLERPSPQTIWAPALDPSVWEKADARYLRSSQGGGQWHQRTQIPEFWSVDWNGIKLKTSLTGFGHLGFFPEHCIFLSKIERCIQSANREINVLNLFAYTGLATLVCLRAGAKVCHVDGSKGAVTWANDNIKNNSMSDLPVRWIVDDVMKFIKRENKRNNKYQGIILDPPAFGRGPKGEVWKLERELPELVKQLQQLLDDQACFFLITCHSANVSIPSLGNILTHLFTTNFVSGNMIIKPKKGRNVLPSGIYGFWPDSF